MNKKVNVKLNDAMDKKLSADQSWQRTYESLGEEVDIDRLCLWMDMCNRTENILLSEERLDRQRKQQHINRDLDSQENDHKPD